MSVYNGIEKEKTRRRISLHVKIFVRDFGFEIYERGWNRPFAGDDIVSFLRCVTIIVRDKLNTFCSSRSKIITIITSMIDQFDRLRRLQFFFFLSINRSLPSYQ